MRKPPQTNKVVAGFAAIVILLMFAASIYFPEFRTEAFISGLFSTISLVIAIAVQDSKSKAADKSLEEMQNLIIQHQHDQEEQNEKERRGLREEWDGYIQGLKKELEELRAEVKDLSRKLSNERVSRAQAEANYKIEIQRNIKLEARVSELEQLVQNLLREKIDLQKQLEIYRDLLITRSKGKDAENEWFQS